MKKDGSYQYNNNGTLRTIINFPKSSSFDIFIRGTGQDSSKKTFELQSIKMYKQDYWIKGTVISKLLNSHDYIKVLK